jgi:hypothetical protein
MSFIKVDEIRQANAAHGHHFFEPDTMRFFRSRVLAGVYGGRYFVTSERAPGAARRYTVRRADEYGAISTAGEGFRAYATAAEARAVAAVLAAAVVTVPDRVR